MFDLVHWPMSFIDLLIGRRHIYLLWLMLVLYCYWWIVTSFKSSLGKKETRTFYVANVIIFSTFSELLWKSTLIVRYKLNSFRPPRANQFYIYALLFDSYTRFTLLDKMVLNSYWRPALWKFIYVTVIFDIVNIV